ncbi:pilus assembly protein TadG-related protein [Streptomyces sp. NBC_01255]|uniref:pilus assembly protein TadG-related protein n=1 Tax=Streptomyces sp. NBC_01255 TaxID=2903798 RepID=UPI002E315C37|nr:pilus assembly protein TadG-related protein [Streptomyces sp. NBC_01255]
MGQAFPVYIAVIAGLLFLAFAYFAVGQGAFARNSAQTAADAAALAAAQDAREQLRDDWLEVVLDPEQWAGFLQGVAYVDPSACQQAGEFAARNQANLSDCERLATWGFRVTVRTTGSESQQATASAEAVIEPRCMVEDQVPTPEPPTSTPSAPGQGEEEEQGPIMGLACDGDSWEIDPENPNLPDAVDLFTVRLSE